MDMRVAWRTVQHSEDTMNANGTLARPLGGR